MVWLAAGRPRPYPVLADIALGLPFVIDAGSNVLGLFAIAGFDALPHAIGWFCLSIAFGLAVAPMVDGEWVAFLLVVGFGASIDILWEIGEYLLMRSGSSGLALTYDNTVQDLAMSFIGAVAAAIVVVTVLWPRDGTPRTPFGWSAGRRGPSPSPRSRPAPSTGRRAAAPRPATSATTTTATSGPRRDGRPAAAAAADRQPSPVSTITRRRRGEREPLEDLGQEDPGDALDEVAARCRRRCPRAGCGRPSRSRTRSPPPSTAPADAAAEQLGQAPAIAVRGPAPSSGTPRMAEPIAATDDAEQRRRRGTRSRRPRARRR